MYAPLTNPGTSVGGVQSVQDNCCDPLLLPSPPPPGPGVQWPVDYALVCLVFASGESQKIVKPTHGSFRHKISGLNIFHPGMKILIICDYYFNGALAGGN